MNAHTARRLWRLPLPELMQRADAARRAHAGDRLDLCAIVNAKSGRCSEDCRFCAQAARHRTGVPVHPLLRKGELLAAARRAKKLGAKRFGIVTSGNRLTAKELAAVADAVAAIRAQVGIRVCASLGCLTRSELAELKAAGITRYHHNLETAERHYRRIVTTHAYRERVRTVAAAQEAGLPVCSGGIIGLGETAAARLQFALELAQSGVDSIPVNILVGVPGTPLAKQPPLPAPDALRFIAMLRLLRPEATIRLAAGRETVLKDWQGAAFMAGANGMMIGGYLTVKGRAPQDDERLIADIRRLWRASR